MASACTISRGRSDVERKSTCNEHHRRLLLEAPPCEPTRACRAAREVPTGQSGRLPEPASRHGCPGSQARRCRLTTPTHSGRIAPRWQGRHPCCAKREKTGAETGELLCSDNTYIITVSAEREHSQSKLPRRRYFKVLLAGGPGRMLCPFSLDTHEAPHHCRCHSRLQR